MTEDKTTEPNYRKRGTVDSLQFALATSSELSAYLANLNCGSEDLVLDDTEPNWDHLDDTIDDIEESLAQFEYDWQVFRENYHQLKEEYDNE